MQRFLWGKLVLVLVAVVAILQVVHLILLSRLEAKHHHHDTHEDQTVSAGNEIEATFKILVRSLLKGRILDSSGEYQVVPKLIAGNQLQRSKSSSSPVADIALVTQCSYNHLHNLVFLALQWQGPMSVAVYAEDYELLNTLRSITALRYCHSNIRNNVSFQLVSPLSADSRPLLTASLVSLPSCDAPAVSPTVQPKNYNNVRRYPNNLLRNIARLGINTEMVFVLDVDMVPSKNLRDDFYHYALKNHLFGSARRDDKTVWVVPAFEARENIMPPQTKAELLKLIDSGDTRPFYIELCWKCQVHTDYDAWQKEPPSQGVAPLFEVLWKDPWEPFYISRNNVPFYDERFRQYGFNRISQVCELHVAGYKFAVLNNAFIVHRGLKTSKVFHNAKDEDQERNRILFRQFKSELKTKYPESSRRCY